MGQRLCKWLPSTRTPCAGTQEAAASREPACVLCGRVDDDSSILGDKEESRGYYFHEFCALFANGLCSYVEASRELRFRIEDLIRTVRQAEQTLCFVCGNLGASITCAEPGCDRSFHLPCASEGECITQYFRPYRSYCWEHHPQQPVEAAPAQDTTCIICMEPVGDSRSYSTMVCPACQHAWFHRACIQEQALSAGIHCFQCPLCRDREGFFQDMLNMGIQIPCRNPTWEDNNAYASLRDRHRRCDASDCRYPLGRERSEGEGPWQLLLCSSCAAQGTHRRCSYLSHSTTNWECNGCAGEGTASSCTASTTSSDLAGLSTISQQGLQPSQGSTSQAPGSSRVSTVADGSRSRQPGQARTRSRSPLEHRAAETHSQPRRRRRSPSSRRGPAQGRSRSRVPRRARNITSRPH